MHNVRHAKALCAIAKKFMFAMPIEMFLTRAILQRKPGQIHWLLVIGAKRQLIGSCFREMLQGDQNVIIGVQCPQALVKCPVMIST